MKEQEKTSWVQNGALALFIEKFFLNKVVIPIAKKLLIVAAAVAVVLISVTSYHWWAAILLILSVLYCFIVYSIAWGILSQFAYRARHSPIWQHAFLMQMIAWHDSYEERYPGIMENYAEECGDTPYVRKNKNMLAWHANNILAIHAENYARAQQALLLQSPHNT